MKFGIRLCAGDAQEEPLSYGIETMKNIPELQKRIQQTVADVRQAGIDQMDVRSPNLLWNREAQRVMLIDFERAAVIKFGPKERAMQEVSPNKKRKQPGSVRKMRRKVFPLQSRHNFRI